MAIRSIFDAHINEFTNCAQILPAKIVANTTSMVPEPQQYQLVSLPAQGMIEMASSSGDSKQDD